MGGRPVEKGLKIRTLSVGATLREAGKNYREITDIIAHVPSLNPYSHASIRRELLAWGRGKHPYQEEIRLLSESELNEILSGAEVPVTPGPTEDTAGQGNKEPSEQYERYEHTGKPAPSQDKRAEFKEIAREVFKEMMEERMNDMNVHTDVNTEDMPPEPPPPPEKVPGPDGHKEGGRSKELRKYERKTITVDANLWALVEAEKKRLGLSTGRVLDILLWRALGKPRLSYEEPKTPDS